MRTRFVVALFVIAAFALTTDSSAQQRPDGGKLYRWVDKDGNLQFGDTIPPEYANADRDIFNSQGVRVGFEEGQITPDERAILDQRKAAEEQRRQAALEVARRDRMLLQAYSDVSDIEDLRDRRIELLESQIKVTELYLTNLRKRLVGLQEEASNFKPYTTKPDAPQIPENLALDISRTAGSIHTFEERLSRARADQRALRVSFDNDIERFRELKGGG